MLKVKTVLLFLSFIAIFFLFSVQNTRAQSCTGTVTFSCPQWTCELDRSVPPGPDGLGYFKCNSLGDGVERLNCFTTNGTNCVTYSGGYGGNYSCTGGYGGCNNNSCAPASYTGYQACGGGGSSTTPTPATITPTTPAGGGVGGCKANGESCAGGGGSCCSGYCNGSVCAQRVCN